MGGAYKDDEATRVDASVLRQHQEVDVPFIPEAEASQETARIKLDEIERRALPFKRTDEDRRGEGPDYDEDVENVPELAMTGAMRPVKEPVMPFSESAPRSQHAPPQSYPPQSYPPQSNPPTSQPPSIDPSKLTPKVAPSSLAPLSENPLSVWAKEGVTVNPMELPSALVPPAEAEPLQAKPVEHGNTVRIAIFGAIAVLVLGVVNAHMV